MRIAIVNERWTAGATRCARDLERGLSARHTVLYLPNDQTISPADYDRTLDQFKPDIVHLHSFYGDLPYSFSSGIAQRYPTVITPHDPRPVGDSLLACWNCNEFRTCFRCPAVGPAKRYSLFKHEYFLRRLQKRRVHGALPARTTFVCVSDWMRTRLAKSEVGRLRLCTIYNGIDLEIFRRDPTARVKLALSTDVPVITFLAHHNGWTMDPRKGVHILAKALTEVVLPRMPSVRVLAVGGGMIPNLPCVIPVGFTHPNNVNTYYSAADVFVAPSLGDNLPYTVLEAMACETAVVGSNVGGIPEEIVNGETGWLVPPGDSEALGNALVSALETRQTTNEMGREGRVRVEGLFSLNRFISEHEELYSRLLATTSAC